MKKIIFITTQILCALSAHSSDIEHRIKYAKTIHLLYKYSAISQIIKKPLLTRQEYYEISKQKEIAQRVIHEQSSRLAILQTKQAELTSQLKKAEIETECPTCGARAIACISVTAPFIYVATQTQSIWGFISCTGAALFTIPIGTSLAGVVMRQELTQKEREALALHTPHTNALEGALEKYKRLQGLFPQ